MESRDPTPLNSISAPSPFQSAPPPPNNPPNSSPFAPNSNPNPNPSPMSQPMHLSFESHAPSGPSPPGSQTPGSQTPGSYFLNSSGEPVRKKRGRPRKYGPDGSGGGGNMALALRPGSSPGSNAPGPGSYDGSASDPLFKRKGRPPGSGRKKQLAALGSSGAAFTPHIITVTPGEDVASKIMAFSQQGPRTICVLSANGAISNVTLRQPATSGGLVTYEGRFEIISLSGSFLLAQDGDTRSRTGGLSVALAGSDGRVLGGCVAGMLMASTPVQVVVGSFIAEGKKPKPKPDSYNREPISNPPMNIIKTGPSPAPHMAAVPAMMKTGPSPSLHTMAGMPPPPPHMAGFGPVSTGSSPPSDVMSDDDDDESGSDDDDSGSPVGHHHMGHNNNYNNSGGYSPMGWPLSGTNQARHHESDMKMMSK